MTQIYYIDQMALFCAISKEIARQHPRMPADDRSNAIIKAANDICAAYKMTPEE
jgi:hypothetical protein